MDGSEAGRRATNRETVERAFGLISDDKAAEVGPLVTEDLSFELPYGPGRKPLRTEGREPWLRMNEQTWPAFKRFALQITRVHELLDPDALIVEYESDGEIASTGKPYCNRYVGVFRFRDGQICEWSEFHNPEVPAWAFSPGD
jgi:ketosteroid isomerase-like protein